MREKVVESLELLKELFGDVDSLDKESLKRVNRAIEIIEGNLDNDLFTKISIEEKNIVIEKVKATINELKGELRDLRSQGVVYQATEGAPLIAMLEEQIELLEKHVSTIEEGTEEMLLEPFSGLFARERLNDEVIDMLKKSPEASYFFRDEMGVLYLDYDKIEQFYSLISQDDDLLKRIGELMPILVKKVKADSRVGLAEADLHTAVLANDKHDLFVEYFAKQRVLNKENSNLHEITREYEEAEEELYDILREGQVFQILCKKIIDDKKMDVNALRIRKAVSEDIIDELVAQTGELHLEIENLSLYPILYRLSEEFGTKSIISIPSFLRSKVPVVSIESEREAVKGISTYLANNLKAKQTRYDEAEAQYKEAYEAFNGAMEESSIDVRNYLSGDLESIVKFYTFLRNDAKNNYRLFMTLFIAKLLRDTKELSFEDACEVFSNELEIKEKEEEYRKIVEPINKQRYNALCDLQDEFTRRFIGGNVQLKK